MKALILIFVLCLLNFGLSAQTADTLSVKSNADTLLTNCVVSVDSLGEQTNHESHYQVIVSENEVFFSSTTTDFNFSIETVDKIDAIVTDTDFVYELNTTFEGLSVVILYRNKKLTTVGYVQKGGKNLYFTWNNEMSKE